MRMFSDVVDDQHGNIQPGIPITVKLNGVAATIYSDSGGLNPVNPVTTDPTGIISFYYNQSGIYTFWNGATQIGSRDLQDLSPTTGATLVGSDDGASGSLWTTVAGFVNASNVNVADYTALRAYAGSSKSAYVTGYLVSAAPQGIAGLFTRDDNDTTSGAVFTGSVAPFSGPPAAPTLGSSAGGTLGATTYFVKITYVTAAGETLPSPESSLAVLVNNVLTVTSPSAQTGATGYNVYVGTASGGETLQNTSPIAIGTGWTEPTTGLVSGVAVPSANTAGSVLTVSAVTNGALATYQIANRADTGAQIGVVRSQLTGSAGAAGTYMLSGAATLASMAMVADNGGTLIVAANGKRWKRVYSGAISVRWFGAVGDGVTDDTASVQAALDALASFQELAFPPGSYYATAKLYLSNKNDVGLTFEGQIVMGSPSTSFSLVVHGGTINRVLTGAAWSTQLIESAYETETPAKRIRINNLNVKSASGSRTGTNVMFYFCDDLNLSGITRVQNSDGNGIEFRHCVRPSFNRIDINDAANYGMFVYQCHALTGYGLTATGVGRAYELKQRHKFYNTLDHYIARVEATDLHGVGTDYAWASGADSFNELVAGGYSTAAQTNRNFTGHEICKHVTIGTFKGEVLTPADGTICAPAFHIGCFADGWNVGDVQLHANGKALTANAMNVGARGDITRGLGAGATFGQHHVIGRVSYDSYTSTDQTSLLLYGVSFRLGKSTYANCSVDRIIQQNTNTLLPFSSQVERVEFRRAVGSFTMRLAPLATSGVWIASDTQRFITGGCRLTVTPRNSAGSDSICNPWYIQAPYWGVIGRDEVTVVNGSATNHASTYTMATTAVAGDVCVNTSTYAPTNATGLLLGSSSSTKALMVRPSTFTLSNTPSTTKNAISVAGEVNLIGGNTYTGGWTSTISDTTGGFNSQNLRRTVFLTAAPTTGTWVAGDRTVNIAPAVGSPKAWTCTVGGTPGTWVSEGNL